MKRALIAVSLVVSGWACEGRTPTTPTPPATPTRPPGTLSGLVFAVTPSGLTPVEGARVRLEIGSFRLDALTNENGYYSMNGLYEGSSSITTSRQGYETDTRKTTITGDVRLDIGVVPRLLHTLSGIVYEVTPTGHIPIEGVDVYCDSCGEFGHTSVFTDAKGAYSFPEVFNGSNPLIVRKEGYRDPPGTPLGPVSQGWRQVTVNGDTRFDIELVRR